MSVPIVNALFNAARSLEGSWGGSQTMRAGSRPTMGGAVGQTVVMNPDGSIASTTTDMSMPAEIRYDPAAYGDWEPAGQEGMMYAGNAPSYNPATGYYRAFNEATGQYDYWKGGEGGLTGQEALSPKEPMLGPGYEGDPQWKAGILPGGQPAAGYGSPTWEAAQGGAITESPAPGGGIMAEVPSELYPTQDATIGQAPQTTPTTQMAYNQPIPQWSYQSRSMYSPFGGGYGMGGYGGYGGYGMAAPSYYGGYAGAAQNYPGFATPSYVPQMFGGVPGSMDAYGGYMPSQMVPSTPMGGYYGSYGMGGGGYGGGYSPMTGLLNLLGGLGGMGGYGAAAPTEAGADTDPLGGLGPILGGLFGGK